MFLSFLRLCSFTFTFLAVISLSLCAQAPQALPNAPQPHINLPKGSDGIGALDSIGYVKATCGAGASTANGASPQGLAMCGVGVAITFVNIEVGGIGPEGGSPRLYLSGDVVVPILSLEKKRTDEPFVLFGYTRMFGYSNNLDYGIGWDHHLGDYRSLLFELRDYVDFSSPVRHNPMLRVSYALSGPD